MVILKELMGTAKLWDGWSAQLNARLSNLPDGEVVDLQHCRFGVNAWAIVRTHEDKLKYINTEEDGRILNDILEHNRNIKSIDSNRLVYLSPEISNEDPSKSLNALFDKIKSSPEDSLFSPVPNVNSIYVGNMVAIMALVNLLFPSKSIYLPKSDVSIVASKVNLRSILNYYRSKLTEDDYIKENSFFLAYGVDGYITLDFKLNEDSLRVPGDRRYTKRDMYTMVSIPSWIGTEKPSKSERVRDLSKIIIADIKSNETLKRFKKPATMEEYIDAYSSQ